MLLFLGVIQTQPHQLCSTTLTTENSIPINSSALGISGNLSMAYIQKSQIQKQNQNSTSREIKFKDIFSW